MVALQRNCSAFATLSVNCRFCNLHLQRHLSHFSEAIEGRPYAAGPCQSQTVSQNDASTEHFICQIMGCKTVRTQRLREPRYTRSPIASGPSSAEDPDRNSCVGSKKNWLFFPRLFEQKTGIVCCGQVETGNTRLARPAPKHRLSDRHVPCILEQRSVRNRPPLLMHVYVSRSQQDRPA